MYGSISSSKTGLASSQDRLDVISNNISNVSTDGFKSQDIDFETLLSEKLINNIEPVTGDKANAEGVITGTGSKSGTLIRDMTDGTQVPTGDPLNIAISGKGFFKVTGDNGKEYYTRDSVFHFDGAGNIVNTEGYKLKIDNYDYKKLAQPVKISDDGTVSSKEDAKNANMKITLYDFSNKDSLISAGDNLYVADGQTAAAIPKNETHLMQGFVEKSNVDIEKQLTDMIVVQRGYQMNARALQNGDQMLQLINSLGK